MAQRIITRDEHKVMGAEIVFETRVYSKDEYGDFHVRYYVNGVENVASRYFTGCKEDAHDTMKYEMTVIRATK